MATEPENPYQPPRASEPHKERAPGKPGGRVPLVVASGLMVLGGFSSLDYVWPWHLVTFAFALTGLFMAASRRQRVIGIALVILSLLALAASIYVTWYSGY